MAKQQARLSASGKGNVDKINLIASAEGKEVYEVKLVRPNLITYFMASFIFFALGIILTAGVTVMLIMICLAVWENIIWPIMRPIVSCFYRHRGWETPQRWEYY